MRLCILDDFDSMSVYAAQYFKNRLLKFNPSEERKFVLGRTITCYNKDRHERNRI
jgi:glucosamine-6-phosphate deaminase